MLILRGEARVSSAVWGSYVITKISRKNSVVSVSVPQATRNVGWFPVPPLPRAGNLAPAKWANPVVHAPIWNLDWHCDYTQKQFQTPN